MAWLNGIVTLALRDLSTSIDERKVSKIRSIPTRFRRWEDDAVAESHTLNAGVGIAAGTESKGLLNPSLNPYSIEAGLRRCCHHLRCRSQRLRPQTGSLQRVAFGLHGGFLLTHGVTSPTA